MDKAIHTDKHGTETTKAKVDQLLLREKIKQLREKGYEQEVRAFVLDAKEKQLEYEYRYNHYHDPQNGRFASAGAAGSGANYGQGLYYSMGKGKGEIVGASSKFTPNSVTISQLSLPAQQAVNKFMKKFGTGENAEIKIEKTAKDSNGIQNYLATLTQTKTSSGVKINTIGVGDIKPQKYRTKKEMLFDDKGRTKVSQEKVLNGQLSFF